MRPIAYFEHVKKSGHVLDIWNAISNDFPLVHLSNYKSPKDFDKQPSGKDYVAARLAKSLRDEQIKRRYGARGSVRASIRSVWENHKPSRTTDVYARRICFLRHCLLNSGADLSAAWCPLKYPRMLFRLAASQIRMPLLHLEDAPFPGYFVADARGINMGNSASRDWRDYPVPHSGADESMQLLRESILQRAAESKKTASRMKVRSRHTPSENFIYCPLQVDEDTQLLNYGGWASTVSNCIKIMYDASRFLPANWSLVIREHPSSKISYTNQLLKLSDDKFILDNTGNSLDLVERSRAIVTINSSVGLHGFLFGKEVVTLGRAMWCFGDMATEALCPIHLSELFGDPESWRHSASQRKGFLHHLLHSEFMPLPTGSPHSKKLGSRAQEILSRKITEAKDLTSSA